MRKFFKKIIVVGWIIFILSSKTVMAEASVPPDVDYLRAAAADTKVTVTWQAVTGATGYKIYMGLNSVTTETGKYDLPTISAGNVTEYSVTGLKNGTIYYFAMTALNSEGKESTHYSYEVKAQPTAFPGVPPDFESPSDMGVVTATEGDSKIILKWPAATDNAGVTGYKIYMGLKSVTGDTQTYDLPTITVGKVTEYEVKNLTNGTKYYFAMTALDAAGNESIYYSDEVSGTPKITVVPSVKDEIVPSDVSGVSVVAGDGKLKLKWQSATDNVGVIGYNIYMGSKSVTKEGEEYDMLIIITGNVIEYEISKLTNEKKYYFAVTALDAAGNESANYSDEVSGTPKVSVVPSVKDEVFPSDVSGVSVVEGDAKLKLKWQSATDNVGVTGYKIYMGSKSVTKPEDFYDMPTITTGNVTEYEISKLTNEKKYYFAVTAVDAEGNESVNYSDEVNGTPKASSGDSGGSGDKGNSGDSGDKGDSGNSGNSGDNGSSGNSGDNGGNESTKDDDNHHGGPHNTPVSTKTDKESPSVAYAAYMDKNTIRVIFSESMDISDENKAKEDFEIIKVADFTPLVVTKVVLEKSNPKIVTVSTVDMEDNADYVVRVNSVTDAAGNEIKEGKGSTGSYSTPPAAPSIIQASTETPSTETPPEEKIKVTTPPLSPPDEVANVNDNSAGTGSGQSGLSDGTADTTNLPTSGPEIWVILAIGAMAAGRWVGGRGNS